MLGAHLSGDRGGRRGVVRRVGAERPLGQRGRRLQRLGRAHSPHAQPRHRRRLGALRPRARRGRDLQVRGAREAPGSCGSRPTRSPRAPRLPPHGLRRLPAASYAGATRTGSTGARIDPGRGGADVGVRGAPRLVALEPARGQPSAHLPRARRRARRLRGRHGLHARRAPAGDGAPVRRLVGVPGDGVLRLDRRVSGRPTTSASSSTACTRAGSA